MQSCKVCGTTFKIPSYFLPKGEKRYGICKKCRCSFTSKNRVVTKEQKQQQKDRALATWQRKSAEEKKTIIEKRKVSLQSTCANRSEEERVRIGKHISEVQKSFSPEKKAHLAQVRSQKHKEWYKGLSEKEKRKFSEKISKSHQSKEYKEKIKQTNLERYGVEHYSQSEKCKQAMLERYGVEHLFQLKEIREKGKQTNLERYGVEYPIQSETVQAKMKQTNLERYSVENPAQSEEIREKMKQTNLEKYGVETPLQSEEIREKGKQTNLRKYGVEHPWQSEEIQEKIKQTNFERYGTENYTQSEKCKQTNLSKYGAEYYFQSKEAQSKRKQAYRYDNVNFDSKPELAFYVYCKEHGRKIKRSTQEFLYEFQGKTHRYFPDFVVDSEFYEIKGNHFLKEDSTWQNPYDHSQDTAYEAKHQCAIQNRVKILYNEDYQKFVDYVIEKYGKNFFENCKAVSYQVAEAN